MADAVHTTRRALLKAAPVLALTALPVAASPSGAAALVEAHRAAFAAYLEQFEKRQAALAKLPPPRVEHYRRRDTEQVVMAQNRFDLELYMAQLPDFLPEHAAWRAAKRAEMAEWEAEVEAARQAAGLPEIEREQDRRFAAAEEAWEALAAYVPQTAAEVQMIARHAVEQYRTADGLFDEIAFLDLIEAWGKVA